ncbi:NAD-binding protein, partial [Fomitopsis schrenkii]
MMRAVIVQKAKGIAVLDHPVPTVGKGDILVKVVAVAQNPADWRFVDVVQHAGTILGCDWSGNVIQRGEDVTIDVGAHVAGFVMGGTFIDSGAYAEYVKTPAVLAWVVPPETLTHQQAATVSAGLCTAAQCLYHPKRLGLVEPPNVVAGQEWVFVHGGSSSVGQYTIQLAHLSGYKVVTTASPHNFDLVVQLGADAVYDYKRTDVVDIIKRVTNESIRYAVDTQSTKETQELCARVMGAQGGKLVLMFPPTFRAQKLRKDVEFIPTLIYTALGRPFSLGPKAKYDCQPEDQAHFMKFLEKVPQLFSNGYVVPNRIKLWEGGLQGVSDGLNYMRDGKISGEKIVYLI